VTLTVVNGRPSCLTGRVSALRNMRSRIRAGARQVAIGKISRRIMVGHKNAIPSLWAPVILIVVAVFLVVGLITVGSWAAVRSYSKDGGTATASNRLGGGASGCHRKDIPTNKCEMWDTCLAPTMQYDTKCPWIQCEVPNSKYYNSDKHKHKHEIEQCYVVTQDDPKKLKNNRPPWYLKECKSLLKTNVGLSGGDGYPIWTMCKCSKSIAEEPATQRNMVCQGVTVDVNPLNDPDNNSIVPLWADDSTGQGKDATTFCEFGQGKKQLSCKFPSCFYNGKHWHIQHSNRVPFGTTCTCKDLRSRKSVKHRCDLEDQPCPMRSESGPSWMAHTCSLPAVKWTTLP